MKGHRIFSKKKTNRWHIIIAVSTAIIICLGFLILNGCDVEKLFGSGKVLPQNKNASEDKTYVFPVQYKHIEKKFGGRLQVINILEVDLTNQDVDVKPILSQDQIHGYETTSSMLSRTGAYAGINGGFFDIYGEPSGLMVIDGEYITSSQGYPAFGIDTNNKVFFETVRIEVELNIGNKRLKLDAVNRRPGKEEAVVLTSQFGDTTRMSNKLLNILIEKNAVKEVVYSTSPVKIPASGYIVVVSDSKIKDFNLKAGQKAEIVITGQKSNIRNAVECGPWIIENGKKVHTGTDPWAGKTTTREPRTVLGLTSENKLLLITVDGRQPGKSIGFTGDELADYLAELGAYNAAYLDGGGSTTMWIDGKIVNTPSFQGRERSVGNALGVFLKLPPS